MTTVDQDFVIVGGGAMGSILAAHLVRAGHSVALLVRGSQTLRETRRDLRISGLVDFTAPVLTITDPALVRRAGVLIVATKAIDSVATLAALRHLQVGAALSVQNGIMKDEVLAETFGANKVVGAVADLSGERLSSGEVLFTRNVSLSVGEPGGGASARVARLAETLASSGLNAREVADIATLEWSKFGAWIGSAAVAVTTRVPTWQYLADRDSARVIVAIVREFGRLATASGVSLSDDAFLPVKTLCDDTQQQAIESVVQAGARLRAAAPAHRISMVQDLDAGRPLELDETLGHAVRRGRELGVPLPLIDAFHALACAIERFRTEQRRTNVE